MDQKCIQFVQKLNKGGVNFLAVDFDQTLISDHTGGRFMGTAADLALKVRLLFKLLLPKVMGSNIIVAVVTFSGQTDLIKEVLKIVFADLAKKIIVRAKDNTWGNMGEPNVDGKLKYIASAAEEFNSHSNINITKKTTLLIDDDAVNVRIALKNKVRALLFRPGDPDSIFEDIKDI